MKTNYIDTLARETVLQDGLSESELNRVFGNLSRMELRSYTRLLKKYLEAETLTVVSTNTLEKKTQEELLRKFDKKYFRNILDSSIGAGIVIQDNDDIIDLSVSGEIRRFIRSIS